MSKQIKRSIGARLNEKGLEVLSSLKKAVHIKPRRPVSQHQQFRVWLDAESKKAALKGEDSYEEFTDFGIDEDITPTSQYELVFDPLTGREVLPAEKIWLDKQRAAWELQEREKRKAARAQREQESAIDNYVTKKAVKTPPSSKTAKPKMDDPE